MTAMPPPPAAPVQQQAAGAYASWGSRLVAWFIDGALVSVPIIIGLILFSATVAGLSFDSETGDIPGRASAALVGFGSLFYLAAIAFAVWNQGWRQGTTGQSIVKGIMKISVIRQDGTFMGGGLGIGRMIVHSIVGGACFLNYLWPLWDDRSQTWTDKILDTIVVEA